ncbi:MAG: helix-turn-helix domain-containing protein [Tannerella sp.]|jgi:DNA-binding transcriptional MerR regulator|nr:helix-turn-helix domain-containing protein [Tannerella sp.]
MAISRENEIKGNKALAEELGVCIGTVQAWLKKGLIKPKRRILRTIYYDRNEVNMFKKQK